jgi:hypothetical protein
VFCEKTAALLAVPSACFQISKLPLNELASIKFDIVPLLINFKTPSLRPFGSPKVNDGVSAEDYQIY